MNAPLPLRARLIAARPRLLAAAAVALALAIVVAVLVLQAAGGSAPIPSLYTNANSADVWSHPDRHRGARIDVRGILRGVDRRPSTIVARMEIDNHLVAVHVFDRNFRPVTGAQLRIVGSVRGALGSTGDGIPGGGATARIPAGAALIDAQAVSSTDGTPVSRAAKPVRLRAHIAGQASQSSRTLSGATAPP
ncbi:MAG: hypothetical protein ACR2LV_03175 [Solirubrobacteraceae bacterium]